jgi:hypothetical protein
MQLQSIEVPLASMEMDIVQVRSDRPNHNLALDTGNIHNDTLESSNTVSPADNTTLNLYLKLVSAGFAFFVAGVNDGSLGALLPYVLSSYHISSTMIALL